MLRVAVPAVLVLAAMGCSEPAPPTRASVGQPCTQEDKMTCLGPSELIVCVNGKYETMACRDAPCTPGESQGFLCQNTTFLPGEYCFRHWWKGDSNKHDCSVDRKSQLRCVGKRWELEQPCPGKFGCRHVDRRVRGGTTMPELQCDQAVTNVGAACARENQYACASDFKRTLRCVNAKWQQDQICRGKDGCKETGARVRCDDTLAAVGDACGQDGDQACAVDLGARLVCKSNRMTLDKKCPAGCEVIVGKVRAGREGPSFECK